MFQQCNISKRTKYFYVRVNYHDLTPNDAKYTKSGLKIHMLIEMTYFYFTQNSFDDMDFFLSLLYIQKEHMRKS